MNTQRVRRIVTIVALVFSAAAAARAQDTTSEFTSWRTPGWSFTPGMTVGGVWDSNVALASAPADARTPQADKLFVVQPSAQLEFVSPRTEFSSGYRGFVRRYLDLNQLNGFDQRGYLSLRRLATRRLTYYAAEDFAKVPTTDQVEVNGVPFSRTGARMNSASGGIEARLAKYTDLNVRYENTWVNFDRTDTLLTGGWVNGLRTDVSQHLTEHVAVGAEYGVRFADLNEGTHQLTFQDAGATLHAKIDAHTTFGLAGGLAHLNDRSFNETRTGPYIRAEMTRTGARATAGASFERMFVPSFGFGGSNRSEQVRAFIRMPLDRNRMYLQGSAAWRRSDPFVTTELLLDTIWLRSTLGYSVSRWLRTEGYYAFTRQDSQVAGGQVDRHRLGAQLVISQPMRIR
jgi:hypothetical protein